MFALTRDDTSARMERMVTVTEKLLRNKGRPVVISDFSPPRGADLATVEQAKEIGADFVCVAYSPGKSVRVDSVAMAHVLSLSGIRTVRLYLIQVMILNVSPPLYTVRRLITAMMKMKATAAPKIKGLSRKPLSPVHWAIVLMPLSVLSVWGAFLFTTSRTLTMSASLNT